MAMLSRSITSGIPNFLGDPLGTRYDVYPLTNDGLVNYEVTVRMRRGELTFEMDENID